MGPTVPEALELETSLETELLPLTGYGVVATLTSVVTEPTGLFVTVGGHDVMV